jgi:hypothetical protein
MRNGIIGCIVTPKQGQVPDDVRMIADNGCFGKGYPGDQNWIRWLASLPLDRVQFATAPDVVGDAEATLKRSLPWMEPIRSLGVPAALVAQDGLETMTVPWDEFDALFIGGSTSWKLGPHAAALITQARERGKWVHMGRVNSRRRFRVAWLSGCDSADGTYLTYGPDKNLPILIGWLRESQQLQLEGMNDE